MRLSNGRAGIAVVLLGLTSSIAAQDAGPATTIALKAPDGITLKATYFPAAKPGPGILLLHQCNQDRKSWTPLATKAAASGYHVLTLDYRGYGESDGPPPSDNFAERQAVVQQKWPADIDAAFSWLTAQPGVDKQRIAAAGASCGVNQSVLLARRHPEVRTVALLSGNVTPPGREYLRNSPGLPVFASASHGDGGAVETMRWILGWSSNPANKFLEYQAAGHGTEMFAVEKGLEPAMLAWFDAHLRNAPTTQSTTSAAAQPKSAVVEFWEVLARPDSETRARHLFESSKQRDPKLILFPEADMNLYGYQILQEGSAEHAIWIFKLNVDAYPNSANTYDSLSDAYLAAGKREDALRYAKKALDMLDADKQVGDELRAAIKESAEKKILDLTKKTG
jgi:dienelactone hydrolase